MGSNPWIVILLESGWGYRGTSGRQPMNTIGEWVGLQRH